MHLALTGSAGFIGQEFLNSIHKEKKIKKITLIVNKKNPKIKKKFNKINFVHLDLRKKVVNFILNGHSRAEAADVFDVRKDFTFIKKNFDGCYSHMLYCMALTLNELETLNYKINLKLKEDGINIYTVRNTSDGDFQKGSHIGEDLYEMNGFIVHFFSDEKIKKLLNGYKNLGIIRFDEGNFPRRLSMVINQKTS